MFSKIRLVCLGPMFLIGSRHCKPHPLTPHLAWPPHYSSARPHSSLALPPTLSVPDLPAPLSPPAPWQMEHRLRWRWRWRIRFSFPSAPRWPPVEDRRARGSGGGAVRAAVISQRRLLPGGRPASPSRRSVEGLPEDLRWCTLVCACCISFLFVALFAHVCSQSHFLHEAGRGDFIQVEVQAFSLISPTRMLLKLSEELRGCPMVRGCFLSFLFVPVFLICCIMYPIPFPDVGSICLIGSIF